MTLAHKGIFLQPLPLEDAPAFHGLYQQLYPGNIEVFLPGETPAAFTARILSQCDYLFTIRLSADPKVMVGDCALHHHNPATGEIEIGGSLFPAYQGRGLMQAAFALLMQFGEKKLAVKTLLARTTPENKNAIRLAEKMGFTRWHAGEMEIVFRRNF